ncbi:MAG: 16S rRNA (cytosine(1402)-N(4))-methyltransferase RsmH [Elusimicrobia bacterium]|nr:16S rRNA (cytosine(1402)-N(4))-methyltransferase RsmH [Elusimicrobiota bacterium]
MSAEYKHEPVLLEETVNLLITDSEGLYVDATVGMGGHASKILSKLGRQGKLIGFDWDPEMVNISKNNLSSYGDKVKIIGSNFSAMEEVFKREGIINISGILFDLGVSSLHFDKPQRGFSFKHEGPLDMRINPANPLTAHTIINKWPYEQIEHLIRICGERFSHKIAKHICERREKKEFETTTELKNLIEEIMPRTSRKSNPATKTFLALRVAVNYEFENLTKGIQKAGQFLVPGGRMAIITFHSLEDRIVKETFYFMARMGGWKLITKKPISPNESEVNANNRSRSAKLRVIERIK